MITQLSKKDANILKQMEDEKPIANIQPNNQQKQ